MKQQAISEISRAESELGRAKSAARISQVVDYVFYLIYGVIGLEIMPIWWEQAMPAALKAF
jgi:hypothetical protein